MSHIGDELASMDDEFAEFFEVELRITNYEANDIETAPEEFDDPNEKQETADSPITTTGQVEQPQMSAQGETWDREVSVDVVVYLPSTVTVSDGDDGTLPYPSEVLHVPTGETYIITAIHDEGNGRLRCAAISERD